MTKEKKKPNKNAKAAAKILSNSKLLAAKTANELKTAQNVNPTQTPIKESMANKLRPEKKRG